MEKLKSIVLILTIAMLSSSVSEARETRHVTVSANLDRRAAFASTIPVPTPPDFASLSAASQFYVLLSVTDALNVLHPIHIYYFHLSTSAEGQDSWAAYLYIDGGDVGQTDGQPVELHVVELQFNYAGQPVSSGSLEITLPWTTGATPNPLRITLSGHTSLPAASSLTTLSQDGCVADCSANAGLDFDGDAVDDAAIWRPEFGMWAILKSSTNMTDLIWKQWGLPGDYPMAGDYTGDARADLVVWRPSSGNWHICPSDYDYICPPHDIVQQFGLPGDRPLRGDYDGDGILDLAVWRPSSGMFYYKGSRIGAIVSKQWGLPTDIPLQSGNNR